ncbi:MAG: zinc-dependent alcohol dehydrogenase family protein [Chromatiales bacterium]|jgi:NADPH2:quinone reductase|nr:zinc-dependent alcohol dehydrogenase family protein [Chromatiales bacterium]MDX9767884.1 zinc-dependent alcohol dehydrogenase family protein [Ectothiorhodospiraceae bacterium]
MKAILMRQPGGPEVLEHVDLPDPTLTGEHDMLVRLKAAGVNPVDTKLRARGTYYPERMPAILGCDGAGVIEAVGPKVERFEPGDEVYFCHGGIGGHAGTYAEFAVVSEYHAARKPPSLGFIEAAAVPLVLITAWESFNDRVRLGRGQRVLIHAGAGGVGHVAVQLARLAGAHVVTTVSTPEKAEFVKGLGAERSVLYRSEDFVEAVRTWSDGQGVDLVLDTLGGDALQRSFEAVKPYGDVVTLLQPPVDVDWKTVRVKNLRLSFELMLTPMHLHLEDRLRAHAAILRQGARLFEDGKLRIHVARAFPLDQAAEAHRMLEAGGLTGKLVLSMG